MYGTIQDEGTATGLYDHIEYGRFPASPYNGKKLFIRAERFCGLFSHNKSDKGMMKWWRYHGRCEGPMVPALSSRTGYLQGLCPLYLAFLLDPQLFRNYQYEWENGYHFLLNGGPKFMEGIPKSRFLFKGERHGTALPIKNKNKINSFYLFTFRNNIFLTV